MHALGYISEHQRPERDKFIKIYWENVATGMEAQFRKVDWSPKFAFDIFDDRYYYDYYSIMHLPYNVFAMNRRVTTIVPKC
ncbi:Zinc metalloproteinase nas-15-like protein [Leptotrombidium deliense]|uniref:Zinc metalloproteinase nas-15-like protein n=1 Tax=Leptotrombidium deliense TaxID=299467 RepID=A0A443RZM8_9ACAR|nr:Zinc metalloproteinase nas-15-like protein [Leptotrombidium deliense]